MGVESMLYRDVPCENFENINNEILKYLENSNVVEQSTNFWNPLNIKEMLVACPLFMSWARLNNFKIHSVAAAICKDINQLPRPHTDTPPARFKLSWPVLNYSNTCNRWFKDPTGHADKVINPLGGISYTDKSQLIIIDQRPTTSPGLIDAGTPHDVLYLSEPVFPRVVLQVQLYNEPSAL
jgi:hypothetical protein